MLEFRPRHSAHPLGRQQRYPGRPPHPDDHHEPNDLSRYERVREEPDDFHHRMLANVAAVAFTIALMAVGLWLAKNIAELRKTQDCLQMGRRDCMQVALPRN